MKVVSRNGIYLSGDHNFGEEKFEVTAKVSSIFFSFIWWRGFELNIGNDPGRNWDGYSAAQTQSGQVLGKKALPITFD